MKSPGRFRLHSIVLLIFATGVLWFMMTVLRGGEHPLGMEPNLVLCDVLDTSVWASLPDAGNGGIVRVPTAAAGAVNQCALELDPVPAGHRLERIERGEDADRVREIATVMVITRAALFRQSPAVTTTGYTNAWSDELHADGWPGEALTGPWKRGELFTGRNGRQGVLIEDDGIMIWITVRELATESVVAFAEAVTADLRKQH
jgi:hypothetical protein